MPSTTSLSSVPNIEDVGLKAEEGLARQFREELAALLGRGGNINFPGAQPVSFARPHLKELTMRDYYVCEKSDGIRCLLYCTCEGSNEIHYLVDRKNQYYFVPKLHFPRAPEPPLPGSNAPPQEIDWASFHIETVLDGELLIDTYPDGRRVLKYLVFDCLIMDGQNLMSRTLDKRLAYFMERVYAPYKALCDKFPSDTDEFVFKLEQKSFQFAYGTEMMFKTIVPGLKHGSDGLIFTCRETPYKFGTDEHIFKWKPAWENTIDFQLELSFPTMSTDGDTDGDLEIVGAGGATTNGNGKQSGSWECDYNAKPTMTLHSHYGDDNRTPREERWLYATDAEWASMKEYSIARNDGLDGAIVECHRDEEGRWRFNRFREDKTDANHYTVVEKVMKSIEDGVTEEELIANAGQVRTAWKKRQEEEKERARRQREVAEMERKRKAEAMKKDGEKRLKQDSDA